MDLGQNFPSSELVLRRSVESRDSPPTDNNMLTSEPEERVGRSLILPVRLGGFPFLDFFQLSKIFMHYGKNKTNQKKPPQTTTKQKNSSISVEQTATCARKNDTVDPDIKALPVFTVAALVGPPSDALW